LFSDPNKIIAEFPEMPKKSQDDLVKVREKYTPEEINLDNHPSKRLEALSGETYRKTYHGILIAQNIGLDTIRRECQHFHTWLVQLEQLSIG
jgi:hypothetical protein